MNTLDERALALAAGIVTAVAFSLCATWIAISPQGFMATVGYLLHIDLTPLARTVTLVSYLAGVIVLSAWAGILFGAVGWLYNRLARPTALGAHPEAPVTITRQSASQRTPR